MIAIDLNEQKTLDADLKAIQQINFTKNLEQGGNSTMIFVIEEAKVKLSNSEFKIFKSFIKCDWWF